MTTIQVALRVSAVGRSPINGLFGVAELIPLGSKESGKVVGVAAIGSRQAVVPLTLSPGKYAAYVKLPSGEMVTEAIEIAERPPHQTVTLAKPRPRQRDNWAARRPVIERADPLGRSDMLQLSKATEFSIYPSWPVLNRDGGPDAVYEPVSPWGGEQRVARRGMPAGGPATTPPATTTAMALPNDFKQLVAETLTDARMRLPERPMRAQAEVVYGAAVEGAFGNAFDVRALLAQITPRRDRRREGQPIFLRDEIAYVAMVETDAARNPRIILGRLPSEWQDPQTHMPLHLQVRSVRRPDGKPSLHIEAPDSVMRSLFGFLQHSDLAGSLGILETAARTLFEKQANPYAAAGAGYALLSAPPGRRPIEWQLWMANLGAWFPALSDGRIQHATLLLQSRLDGLEDNPQFPLEAEARLLLSRRLVLDALERGLPLYRWGLDHLGANLDILLEHFESDNELTAAQHFVRSIQLRVDTSQAFTVIDATTLAA